jgi:hypothetical protein
LRKMVAYADGGNRRSTPAAAQAITNPSRSAPHPRLKTNPDDVWVDNVRIASSNTEMLRLGGWVGFGKLGEA